MNYHIYFPQDLLNKKSRSKSLYLLGFHFKNIFIIIQVINSPRIPQLNFPLSKGLEVLGTLNKANKDSLSLKYDNTTNYPVVDTSFNDETYTVIVFDPPNFKNLEYFSINPILLQSTGFEKNTNYGLTSKLDHYEPLKSKSEYYSISDEIVLDKLNQCLRIRYNFDRMGSKPSRGIVSTNKVSHYIFDSLKYIAMIFQILTIWLIKVINYKFFEKSSLTDVLETFKQLDLRLRQVNYFPIQFLCYYDKSILYNKDSEFLKNIEIPFLNSDLNINNSNYINLYNSLWLIVNDVLIGMTFYRIIIENYDFLNSFINEVIIKKLLFQEFYDMIEWVSFDHPAGFKLNNELGQFMGDLFLWTLKFWKMIFTDGLMINMKDSKILLSVGKDYDKVIFSIIKFHLKILCYGGLTFLLSAIVDYIKIITFHLHCFYYTSTRIYNRQIETIKSLFQLFRGKKYNLLRNRIDSLELSERFEIDQLLLGTLLFMVLIYLLPTVFAFYLMFFIIRIIILTLNNFIESIITFINFIPLFIILLKFKNSNRLQGGITINFLSNVGDVNYLCLSNKSLTYNEILRNFYKLFKIINFKSNILKDFFLGNLIFLNDLKTLKFNYLMIPKNYDKTIEVWNHFKTK